MSVILPLVCVDGRLTDVCVYWCERCVLAVQLMKTVGNEKTNCLLEAHVSDTDRIDSNTDL